MKDIFTLDPRPTTLVERADVARFMKSHMQVTSDLLWEAIDVGMGEAAVTTEHSTAAAYGTRLWDGAIRSLRDQLKPLGWKTQRPGRLEVVRRPDNLLQIAPSLGTADTGALPPANPKWLHPRGVSTTNAIHGNQLSLSELAPKDGALVPIETWWLLYYVTARGGETIVRAEVSMPVMLSSGGVVTWRHRVLLGERNYGDSIPAFIPEAAPDPVVPVKRRAV